MSSYTLHCRPPSTTNLKVKVELLKFSPNWLINWKNTTCKTNRNQKGITWVIQNQSDTQLVPTRKSWQRDKRLTFYTNRAGLIQQTSIITPKIVRMKWSKTNKAMSFQLIQLAVCFPLGSWHHYRMILLKKLCYFNIMETYLVVRLTGYLSTILKLQVKVLGTVGDYPNYDIKTHLLNKKNWFWLDKQQATDGATYQLCAIL